MSNQEDETIDLKIDIIVNTINYMKETAKKIPQLRQNKSHLEQQQEKDIQKMLEMRKKHRELYMGLDELRKKNQIEKEQLDKETIHSECLEYQKNQLISTITSFKNFQTVNFDKLKWLFNNQDNLLDKNVIMEELENELKMRKQKKIKLEECLNEKVQLEEYFEKKNQQFFQELPQTLKKIQGDLTPVLDCFELPTIFLPQQQVLISQLPQPLLNIFQLLGVQEEIKSDNPIKVEIVQNSITKEINLYQLHNLELKLHILRPEALQQSQNLQLMLNYFNSNVDEFFKDIYPIVIQIKYFPQLNKVVFQVDRKNKLLTEELLCGLVKNQPGEQLFTNPTNEEERNINIKYIYFEWIQAIAGISNYSSERLSGNQIIDLIHKRVFHIQQLKIQLEQLKNCEFPQPLPGYHQINSQLKLKYFGNINSSQIKEKTPFWNNFFQGQSLYQINLKQKDLNYCIKEVSKEKSTLLVPDVVLENFIQENYCLEQEQNIYKMIIEKEDVQIEIALIIPLRYPYQTVRFLLVESTGISIDSKDWLNIQKKLQMFKQQQDQLIGGCEGLYLSFLVYRLNEELMKIMEIKRKPKLTLK